MKQKSINKILCAALLPLIFAASSCSYFYDTPRIRVQYNNPAEISPEVVVSGDIEDDGFLRLVNTGHMLENDNAVPVAASLYVPVTRDSIKMNKTALSAISIMLTNAADDGISGMLITSGFRTFDEQTVLYERAKDKSYVQKPGCSEHQTGLAADIQLINGTMNGIGKTKQGKWLAANSWEFGLILRYPDDKTDLTGISYEPWHFRYVGLPHSAYIYENNLCLEEYIEFLEKSGGYTITVGDTEYEVTRIAYDENPDLPDGTVSFSSDNCGATVITRIINKQE